MNSGTLQALNLFIKQLNRVDAILFNNGLHGGHLDDEKYYQNYRDIVSFLRENHKDIPIYIIPFWEIDKINSATDLFKDTYRARTRWKNDEEVKNSPLYGKK